MKRDIFAIFAISLCLMLSLGRPTRAYAQEKTAAGAAKGGQVVGTVQRVDKNASTIDVMDKNNIIRVVVYSDTTVFTKAHEPGGSVSDLEQGMKVTCFGKFEGRNRLVASKINIRQPRK